eukprot:GHVL01031971.1.p1 GENE.GHVL01031971.1~~GHVL01031971.1.p1  ORF type:complete len:118 (+),score=9.79 GHVL01031971.1:85-438(+)
MEYRQIFYKYIFFLSENLNLFFETDITVSLFIFFEIYTVSKPFSFYYLSFYWLFLCTDNCSQFLSYQDIQQINILNLLLKNSMLMFHHILHRNDPPFFYFFEEQDVFRPNHIYKNIN